MKISEQGIAFIKKVEGFEPKAKKDIGGLPTIGYGTTYYMNGKKVQLTDKPLTPAEADKILRDVLARDCERYVNEYITSKINQNQYDALVSFVYNEGNKSLRISTLRLRVNRNPNDPTIKDAFLMWVKYTVPGTNIKLTSKGLVNRRKYEIDLYFNGKWKL